jgi:glycolate oxidase iron-sulfur subunit
LLQRLGYRVNSPAPHNCCGALHQHNGAPETARQLADANLQAFSGDNNPVLVTASGCTAHLLGYKTLYTDKLTTAFADRVSDIMHFLAESGCADMQFRKPQHKVAVYMPCTHRNSLKQQQDVMDVLKWIPGLEPVVINPDGGCCGAAGSYMLSQPELSERLCNTVVERILESGAGLLLTTNIGCSIQLQAALKQRAAAIEVLHPVVLLSQCERHL